MTAATPPDRPGADPLRLHRAPARHANDDPGHDLAAAAEQAARLIEARRHDFNQAVLAAALGHGDAGDVARTRMRVHGAIDLLLDANAIAWRRIAARLKPGLPLVRQRRLPVLAADAPPQDRL